MTTLQGGCIMLFADQIAKQSGSMARDASVGAPGAGLEGSPPEAGTF